MASDTIVGISSAPGGSPRGIVRLSGPEAVALAGEVFARAPAGTTAWSSASGTVAGPLGCRVPARILIFRRPRSYTREDVVEIHTIGAPPLLAAIAGDLAGRGARAADPGEFTARAFLNGRIDLLQAEAVGALIGATDAAAYRRAQRMLAGGVGEEVRAARDAILDLRAGLEAELNFPEEEDVRAAPPEAVAAMIDASIGRLERLAGAGMGPGLGVRIVLVGKANAGKSSLFNALLGEERALVHTAPGTTTDAVTAEIVLAGVGCTLVDTAGTGVAGGILDVEAGAAREREVQFADIALGVVDLADPDRARSREALRADGRLRLMAGTKADLVPGAEGRREAAADDMIPVSSVTGEGIAELREALAHRVCDRAVASGELVSARQREGIRGACAALARARAESARAELCALELRAAEEALSEVLGEGAAGDVLGAVFGRFCIGK